MSDKKIFWMLGAGLLVSTAMVWLAVSAIVAQLLTITPEQVGGVAGRVVSGFEEAVKDPHVTD